MLALSPPLPIIIDFFYSTSGEDDEGIIHALEWRDRVRSITLRMPAPNLQNLVMNIDSEYPALEYLFVVSTKENETTLLLPETFQAPHLRYLQLSGVGLPIGPQFLTTAVHLVTLTLSVGHPSSYFHPNNLHQWLSFVPQLEKLQIAFSFLVSNSDVERQLMHAPIMTTITLPNLRCFEFEGASAYLEAVIRWTTTPRLGKLGMKFKQRRFFIPSLLHFTNKSKNLKFDSAKFKFSRNQIDVGVYLREAEVDVLSINVHRLRLDWRATSVARVFNSLCQISQIFSAVEHIILDHEESFMLHYEVDRTEWRKLLRPFMNVKTLRIEDRLVKDLSRSLQLIDGEDPLELLPKLEELTYSGSGDTDDAFTSFIDVRQNAGRPVTQVQVFRSRYVPDLTTASSEAEIDLDT
jgi:hypothetical protein